MVGAIRRLRPRPRVEHQRGQTFREADRDCRVILRFLEGGHRLPPKRCSFRNRASRLGIETIRFWASNFTPIQRSNLVALAVFFANLNVGNLGSIENRLRDPSPRTSQTES